MTGEDEPKKRRELLARRPSYRRILNELSSTEAQGAVASLTEEAKEEQEDDPDGTITVAGTQYHTAAGLLKGGRRRYGAWDASSLTGAFTVSSKVVPQFLAEDAIQVSHRRWPRTWRSPL